MLAKRIFNVSVALVSLILLLPLIALVSFAIKATSKGPVIFRQRRWGKGKKTFTMYKFRTMEVSAEKSKAGLLGANEADGPVFKIYDDPRYSSFGRFLAHTGLDELPQLVNVLKGEMSLVGPRPLPVEEAKRVPGKFAARFSVLPGITSSWIIQGSHKMSFDEWMELDLEYVRDWTLWEDVKILFSTWVLMLDWILGKLLA